jgi:hypothetical protein
MRWSVLIVVSLLGRWGEVGHRLIGAAAAAALPADMPAFFRAAHDQLSYLNPEPDRWRSRAERSLDPAEDDAFAPDHYIDLERIPPGAFDARDRFTYLDSLRAHGVDAALGGLLPFRILELTQRLREEFRLWRSATDARTRGWIEARIINDAGILGHYVADGSNPPNALVPRLYDLEKHATFDSSTTDAADRQFAAERLTAGARMLRDIWWTAWVTSGQTVETAESVVAHDLAARGGADRIHALRTVRQVGFLINGRDTSRFEIESKLPDAVREEITQKGKTLVRAFDGRTGCRRVPGSGSANLMTPAEQKDIAHEADVLTPLVDYAAKGNRVTLLGTESVEGRDAYRVQVTLRDSTVVVYDIDRATYLPIRWQGGPWAPPIRHFRTPGLRRPPARADYLLSRRYCGVPSASARVST